jgi:NADPH:quinone reductase-like Zn-dependent oxidoreductase
MAPLERRILHGLCGAVAVFGIMFVTANVSGQSASTEPTRDPANAKQEYRQVVISEYGGPEVLTLIRHATLPVPGPGEVRIKVLAAGVSFTDTMVRKGIYPGVEGKLPYSPGYDLVGVVDALGEGVSGLEVGQRVADLSVWGAYTDYAIRPAQHLVPVPEGVDSAHAVSLILSYTTAYQMLHRVAGVQAGQSILIHGASGGVGTALAQLGKAAGLKMYGTASTTKQDYVASLGVEPIDYKTEDFVSQVMTDTNQRGVNAVFDAVSVDNFERSYKTLKPGGALVVYGFYAATADATENSNTGDMLRIGLEFLRWSWLQFKWNNLSGGNRSVSLYLITQMRDTHPEWFKEDLSTLFRMLADGEVKPNIWKVLPLEDAAHAHRIIEGGGVQGKVVLRLVPDPIKPVSE